MISTIAFRSVFPAQALVLVMMHLMMLGLVTLSITNGIASSQSPVAHFYHSFRQSP
jgi:hypothetical protein